MREPLPSPPTDARRRSEQLVRVGAGADVDVDVSGPEATQSRVADSPTPPSASEGEQTDVEAAMPGK